MFGSEVQRGVGVEGGEGAGGGVEVKVRLGGWLAAGVGVVL